MVIYKKKLSNAVTLLILWTPGYAWVHGARLTADPCRPIWEKLYDKA